MKISTYRIQKRARVRVRIVHVLVHVADLNLSIRGMKLNVKVSHHSLKYFYSVKKAFCCPLLKSQVCGVIQI